MSPETLAFNQVLSIFVFLSNVFVLIIIVSLLFQGSVVCRQFLSFIKRHSYILAFIIAWSGVFGSLAYSEFIGFEPCPLCWVQRIFLYPTAVIFTLALIKREKTVTDYVLSLSILGGVVAFYHYLTQWGGISLTECTGEGGSCSVIYFTSLGYITIPFMAFSVFVLIVSLMLADKFFVNKI